LGLDVGGVLFVVFVFECGDDVDVVI